MACFAAGAVDGPGARYRARWLPWLFCLLAGLSFLVKGLVGPVFVFGACGLYAAWAMVRERDGRPMHFLASPIGVGLFLLPVLAWAVPAFLRCPAYLDDQVLHHFGRMRGEQGGARDPFFYFYSIPLVLLPWTPFVVGGLIAGARQAASGKGVRRPSKAVAVVAGPPTALEGRRTKRFLIWLKGYPVPFSPFWRLAVCWIVPGLAVLCLSVFKRDHYLAPLMPPLSVAGAVGLVAFVYRRGQRARREFALGAAAIVTGCTAGLAAVMVLTPLGCVELAAVVGVLGAGLLATLCLEHFHSPAAHLAGTFATVWLVAVAVLGCVMPHHDSYREETQFARRVSTLVPEGEPLYLVELYENQVCYYLEPPLVRVDDPGQLAARVAPGDGDVYLLAGEETGRARAGLGRLEVLDQCPNRRWYLADRGRLTLFRLDRSPTLAATGNTRR
jgi:4-amino-4-deoxy-L-arabinose transferase-like glycosyltransferase